MFLFLIGKVIPVYSSNEGDDFSFPDDSVDSIMTVLHIPGIQLAIIQDDEIVYQKSYGWADKEGGVPVSNSSLFRIASISKPITMTAVLKLMEENKLHGEQLVFGENGILSADYEIPDNDRIKQITLQNLLDHTSGWVNEPDDPMFWNACLSKQQIIQKILSSRSPEYKPGTQYYYSNFGYCIVGRIIEKITGMDYETYVNREILFPCGILDMHTGKDTYEARYPNEVVYYSTEEIGAYAMPVNRMDAHGGWIASATDLAKFLMHINRHPKVKDIISEQQMQNSYFSQEKWSHSGSLPGTTTLLTRQNDHWGYAVTTNTRTTNTNDIIHAVQSIMDQFLISK